MVPKDPVICVVGLGYVGLPLAHAFACTAWKTYGYDVDTKRIEELLEGKDRTGELRPEQLKDAPIEFSSNPEVIAQATVVILAIPTPIDHEKKPDLSLLKSATHTVAEHVQDGAIVVYESTVYPGVTEEICGPILKEKCAVKLGYSPERINPGDRKHTIDKIVKVVAGEDEETLEFLATLYGAIVPVGIHKASSIKVAEMAKAIENAQRDLNIAYINEIAMLCGELNISTNDVLSAARTKWNFLPFSPGLVGGHCIGVDPYYLLAVAKQDEHFPKKLIEAARAVNDNMSKYIVSRVYTLLETPTQNAVLVLGLTFKENVPDERNSKAREVAHLLEERGCIVHTHDPYVAPGELIGTYDAIVLLVPHKEYLAMQPSEFAALANKGCLFFDLKSSFSRQEINAVGMRYLAL